MAAGISSADLCAVPLAGKLDHPRHLALFEAGPDQLPDTHRRFGTVADAARMAGMSVIYANSLGAAAGSRIIWTL